MESERRPMMATKKKAAPRKRSVKPKPPAEEPLMEVSEQLYIVYPDGTLLRADGDPVVYVMDKGQRRPFADLETFHACCGGGARIAALPPNKIEPIPVGEIVTGPADLQ
jgi:hypothetical protein